jgi:hypothetical protein
LLALGKPEAPDCVEPLFLSAKRLALTLRHLHGWGYSLGCWAMPCGPRFRASHRALFHGHGPLGFNRYRGHLTRFPILANASANGLSAENFIEHPANEPASNTTSVKSVLSVSRASSMTCLIRA